MEAELEFPGAYIDIQLLSETALTLSRRKRISFYAARENVLAHCGVKDYALIRILRALMSPEKGLRRKERKRAIRRS
jgi:hypothetical protein